MLDLSLGRVGTASCARVGWLAKGKEEGLWLLATVWVCARLCHAGLMAMSRSRHSWCAQEQRVVAGRELACYMACLQECQVCRRVAVYGKLARTDRDASW